MTARTPVTSGAAQATPQPPDSTRLTNAASCDTARLPTGASQTFGARLSFRDRDVPVRAARHPPPGHPRTPAEDNTAVMDHLRALEDAHDERVGADGKGPFPVPFDMLYMTVEVRWPEPPMPGSLDLESKLPRRSVAWQRIKGRRRYHELARRAVLNRR